MVSVVNVSGFCISVKLSTLFAKRGSVKYNCFCWFSDYMALLIPTFNPFTAASWL